MNRTANRARGSRPGRRAAFGLLAVAVAAGCSSGEETFCELGAAIPSVDVDVSALGSAREVCVADDACVAVIDGTVELAEPVITGQTEDVRLTVRDDQGAVLADAEVRLPRYYGNGFECGGDAPQGTVTFGADGGVDVSEDTEGPGGGTGR